jgi:ribonuclease-3
MRTHLTEDDLAAVEAVVGRRFADRSTLRRALTHSSASSENNEPLATLGDAIHKVWVVRNAQRAITAPTKAALTGVINNLCDGRRSQAPLLRALGLDGYLVLGGALLGNGGIVTDDMAATLFEAIVAAIELDAGREVAEAYLDRVGAAQFKAALQRYARE